MLVGGVPHRRGYPTAEQRDLKEPAEHHWVIDMHQEKQRCAGAITLAVNTAATRVPCRPDAAPGSALIRNLGGAGSPEESGNDLASITCRRSCRRPVRGCAFAASGPGGRNLKEPLNPAGSRCSMHNGVCPDQAPPVGGSRPWQSLANSSVSIHAWLPDGGRPRPTCRTPLPVPPGRSTARPPGSRLRDLEPPPGSGAGITASKCESGIYETFASGASTSRTRASTFMPSAAARARGVRIHTADGVAVNAPPLGR